MNGSDTLLITVTGPDRPGITAGLAEVLDREGVHLLDVEQTTTLRLLSLSILIALEGEGRDSVLKDLLFRARELGVHLDFQAVDANDAVPRDLPSYALTCVGKELSAGFLRRIAAEAARANLNIDRISRMSRGSLHCLELLLRAEKPIEMESVRRDLMAVGAERGVNVGFQPEDLFRRAKRLVVFDMDSTLIRGEIIDALATRKGIGEEISSITARAMRGELDFRQALRERVARLEGMTEADLRSVYDEIEVTPGARELVRVLRRLGYRTAVVSGGFTWFTEKLRMDLGLDYAHGSQLEIVGGRLTGRILGPIVDAQRKADLVTVMAQQEGILLDQVVAVGDGANDLPMLAAAGLGIAFNAKPRVREEARHSLDWPDMLPILFLLGIREEDVDRLGS